MKKSLGIIALILVLVQLGTVHVYAQEWEFPRPRVHDMSAEELAELEGKIQNYVMGKTLISVINTLMMSYILWFYYMMYRENGSKFSLGLIALSGALMIYTIASNPWVLYSLSQKSFRVAGLFTILPDLFTSVAAAIMIYLTRT